MERAGVGEVAQQLADWTAGSRGEILKAGVERRSNSGGQSPGGTRSLPLATSGWFDAGPLHSHGSLPPPPFFCGPTNFFLPQHPCRGGTQNHPRWTFDHGAEVSVSVTW